jgi:transposase InsO family protein
MRALLVDRIRQHHWSPTAAAAAAGISVRCAYKWLARYRVGGTAALEDRASTPQRQPRRTSAALTARILAARYERRTAWAIAVQLQVPRSTVAAILARAGLNRLTRLTAPPPVQRYEWAHPGDLVHLDVKPLARIAGVGHRIHGDRRARVQGIGWEYVHVAIDDHSRAAYVEVLPDQTGATTASFLQRTVVWFARRGVRLTRVLTDNGGNYRSRRFQAKLSLKRARPYRPQTNGKAERFIQTLLREWAYVRPYASSARRTQALAPWVRTYNVKRPHAALNYQPPCSRFPRVAQ